MKETVFDKLSKFLYGVIFLLVTGCNSSHPYLSQFEDKGLLKLQPLLTFDSDVVSNTLSMIQMNDWVIWDKCYRDQGTVIYTYHIKNQKFSIHSDIDDTFNYFSPQTLYKLTDSTLTCFCPDKRIRTDLLVKNSIQKLTSHSVKIRERGSFNWVEDYIYFSTIYPTDATANFIAQTNTKRAAYGVYEQAHQYFYPSTSCEPPGEKEMPSLSPDFWNSAYIIKQKNKNRFAIFRKYYQLFDLIEVNDITIKPLKRSSTPHTLLTFQDQLNLERQIVYDFFPGLSVESEKYIITLYQYQEQRYLLFWSWDGDPQFRYQFPSGYEIAGLCGNGENQIFGLGIAPDKKYQLFTLKY